MNENKNPEIVYIEGYLRTQRVGLSRIGVAPYRIKDDDIEYILKSKYDEIERANRVSRNLAEMAKSNYDDLKILYDTLLKEKEGLEDKLENCEILKSACEKANAEMQGTRSATYHQLCPKCNGQGIVQKPPHVAGDVNEWISSNTIYTCDVCNGNKTLIMPIEIKPTEK